MAAESGLINLPATSYELLPRIESILAESRSVDQAAKSLSETIKNDLEIAIPLHYRLSGSNRYTTWNQKLPLVTVFFATVEAGKARAIEASLYRRSTDPDGRVTITYKIQPLAAHPKKWDLSSFGAIYTPAEPEILNLLQVSDPYESSAYKQKMIHATEAAVEIAIRKAPNDVGDGVTTLWGDATGIHGVEQGQCSTLKIDAAPRPDGNPKGQPTKR